MFGKLFRLTSILLLPLTVVFVLVRFGLPSLSSNDGVLSVNTPFQSSTVFLDGNKLGTTPFFSKTLRTGDHTLRLESEGTSWETKTTLSNTTFSTLDLNLSKNPSFISGESLYLRPGSKTLVVLSKPEKAKVLINNEEKGTTPLNLATPEGVILLTVKKDGYLTRELTPNVASDYRLTANVFLSVDPFGTVKKLDSSSKLTLFSLHNSFVNLSRSFDEWAEGLKFTQRQLNSADTRFDVLLDPNGKIFILEETEWRNKVATKAVGNIGYLATRANETLSEKALAEWEKLKSQFN